MTHSEWFEDPTLRMRLAEQLRTSPLKEALEVLTHHGQPVLSSVTAGIEALAITHARNSGYFDFARDLVALSKDPADARKPLPEPWAHAKNL